MNKRYIDFVPANGASDKTKKARASGTRVEKAVAGSARVKKVVAKNVVAKNTVTRNTQTGNAQQIVGASQTKKTSVVYRSVPEYSQVESRVTRRGLRMDNDAKLGVIEDLNDRFVTNEIEKRPLGGSYPVKKDELKEAKSRRLLGRKAKKTEVKPVEKPVENPNKNLVNGANGASKATYKMPKSPFINQEKVVKRPLSKNAYQKIVVTPEEKPSGPVAIIAKPEKDKSISLVVTIIITIILGAAAGTVAFLLLPK